MTTVLATGAYLKNRAGLWQDGRFTASPLHGDLDTAEACRALEASVDDLLAQAGGRVDAVAHDLHPDFHSTRLAQALAARLGVPAIGVQHHAAHIAVALAGSDDGALDRAGTEADLAVGPVIGIALDGHGLGPDGSAWGGEVLWVDGGRWRRVAHLSPIALAGGDRAAREPWRLAAAVLHALGRGDEIEPRFAPQVGRATARGLQQMLDRHVNCPPTTSAGRWFDAAAAALGLSVRQAGEADAAMALESCAAQALEAAAPAEAGRTAAACAPSVIGHRPVAAAGPVDPRPTAIVQDGVIDLHPVLAALLQPADGPLAPRALAFHHALADGLATAAGDAARAAGTGTVVLAGGCLANRVLSARLRSQLAGQGLAVRQPPVAECGDAGLARGQAWLAAMQWRAASSA